MTYVWTPPPALPWCVTCLMSRVLDREQYTCPLCPTERPCPVKPTGTPISAGWPSWLPTRESLARMHGAA